MNPTFSKAYRRMFQCQIKLGDYESAKLSLSKVMEVEPNDNKTTLKDQQKLDKLLNQERVV